MKKITYDKLKKLAEKDNFISSALLTYELFNMFPYSLSDEEKIKCMIEVFKKEKQNKYIQEAIKILEKRYNIDLQINCVVDGNSFGIDTEIELKDIFYNLESVIDKKLYKIKKEIINNIKGN